MPFEYYQYIGNEKLRFGYTTGTCAALASKAAVFMLLNKKVCDETSVMTPKGIEVKTEIYDINFNENFVSCAVKKDGGDDYDATDGLMIYAKAERTKSGIEIEGGKGVGRVTKKGLDQPVGSAAINSVPQKMIQTEVKRVCKNSNYNGGIKITLFVPEGEKAAEKTFNPNIGIVGGISIIGTSGIVEPKSLKALADTVKLEIGVIRKSGSDKIIITPGNYGENYIKKLDIDVQYVKCSNFVGVAVEKASQEHFKDILLVGHIGKFIKLSGGIMNTHSAMGDCRMEILASYAALFGIDKKGVEEIFDCAVCDEALDIINQYGLLKETMDYAVKRAQMYIMRHADKESNIGIVFFSNKYGLLAESTGAEKILAKWRKK
ncbi:MAG: cobalt-precorrin-5B (C(1))-methyltransferase CbiD [Clostridia bacterium]|jgi:cobalt-precorrin-5B (C1)-methyltransferase|nr:cobalt-precorrin-5B (C(1))-methyltransferase CbiD [Clostridia bacterium]